MKNGKSSKNPPLQEDNNELIAGLVKRIKELEKKLEEKRNAPPDEEYYEDIYENMSDGIIYTTLTGKILSINRTLEKMIDIPGEKIIGNNIIRIAGRFLNAEGQDKLLPVLRDILAGKDMAPFQVQYNDKVLEVSVRKNLKNKRLIGTVRDITELKKMITALRLSESRLKRAELTSKSGNWELHLDTGTIVGSVGAMKLYGFEHPFSDYADIKEIPMPEYREMMDKALQELIKDNKPYDIEFRIRNQATGEILDIHSLSEYDKETRTVFGAIQDITVRKKAEEELKNKSNDLGKLLELTVELLEVVDKKKVFEKVVEKGPALTGAKSGAIYSISGENLYLDATYPPLPDDFPDEFRRAALKNHPHIQNTILKKAHTVINDTSKVKLTPEEKLIVETRKLYSLLYVPLIADKEVTAVLIYGSTDKPHKYSDHEMAICRALSNIASLALENSILLGNLIVAKEKAEESDRLKTAFLHNISHEIRTPLNAIMGFSRLLSANTLDLQESKGYYEVIEQSNNQLLSIINDIINISRIESGQEILNEKPVRISQIIRNIYNQYNAEAIKKNLQFTLLCDDSIEDSIIVVDDSKIIQVLNNLLNNAFKFTDTGSVILGYRRSGNLIEFFVKDTGIGIPASEHGKIFRRFYQVDNSLTKAYGGTGLGLSISESYIKMMGGTINLDSAPGQGSVFTFRVPFKSDESVHLKQPKETVSHNSDRSENVTILIAEDDPSNFALLRAILQSSGYRIIHAPDGEHAVNLCGSKKIDLVLMDIRLPVINGLEATRMIKREYPKLPVIAQSAYAHPDDVEKAMECGCVDYITKPFDKDRLLTVISKYI